MQRKLSDEQLIFIDNLITENREITYVAIKEKRETQCNISVHISTIKRVRKDELHWVCSKPRYCQLIRVKNREARLKYTRSCLDRSDQFENANFTDKSSIELDHTARLQFRSKHEVPNLDGRLKHPLKVHVWAGISSKGATEIVIFEGIVNSEFILLYLRIV